MAIVRNSVVFGVLMGVGAASALGRMLVTASLLSSSNFGIFATVASLGVFCSTILGFGHVEAVRKEFPRFYARGRGGDIRAACNGLFWESATRLIALTSVISALVWAIWGAQLAWWTAATGIVAIGNVCIAIFASALRASEDLRPFGQTQLVRAVATITATSLGTWALGLTGAILGEICGLFLGAWFMAWRFRKLSSTWPGGGDAYDPSPLRPLIARDGVFLFIGTQLFSAPYYISRPIAGSMYDLAVLGKFSALLIIVTAVQTGYSILDQILGPVLVRDRERGRPVHAQRMRLVMAHSAALVIVLIALGAVAIASAYVSGDFAAKFAFTGSELAAIVALCALQGGTTLLWMLQAYDREEDLLVATGLGFGAFIVISCAAWMSSSGFTVFLWGIVGGKLIETLALVIATLRLKDGIGIDPQPGRPAQ